MCVLRHTFWQRLCNKTQSEATPGGLGFFVLMHSRIRTTPRALAARIRSSAVGATRPVSMRDTCVRCVPTANASVDCVYPRLSRSLRIVLPMKFGIGCAPDKSDLQKIDLLPSSRQVTGSGRPQRRQALLTLKACRRLHDGQVSMSLIDKSDESIIRS